MEFVVLCVVVGTAMVFFNKKKGWGLGRFSAPVGARGKAPERRLGALPRTPLEGAGGASPSDSPNHF